MATTTCSYCPRIALYVGAGDDGDFYCETHKGYALYTPIRITW